MAELSEAITSTLAGYYEEIRGQVHRWVDPLTTEQMWARPFGFQARRFQSPNQKPDGNSVGHLLLHLTGNLNYYIGAQIAGTGYERHRDLEFTARKKPKERVLAEFDRAIAMVAQTIRRQSPEDWTKPYSGEREPFAKDRFTAVFRCAAHAYHHVGQLIYLSKELTKPAAQATARWPQGRPTPRAENSTPGTGPCGFPVMAHRAIISLGMATGRHKAVVLLSGGMDSCVTAAIANETCELALLHASYGQRTERRERQSFENIADFYHVRERLLIRFDSLAQIGGSALTNPEIAVPQEGETLGVAAGIPITYVPFRNAHFLSAAVSWAEVIGANSIFVGAVEEDSSGYPDCRPAYYRAFEQVIREGTRPQTRIEIVTPVIGMKKSEIVRRGMELGAPLDRTWSCYQFEDEACGICDSCRLRLRAFSEAGATDPVAYRAQVAR
jgi:7-cyano-7-deazaguanine synthase